MPLSDRKTELIQAKLEAIRAWITDEAPYIQCDQKHLDEHTPERAYWHYGYAVAMQDILDLATRQPNQAPDTGDTSNQN